MFSLVVVLVVIAAELSGFVARACRPDGATSVAGSCGLSFGLVRQRAAAPVRILATR
jgi:hypothetical protein